MWRNYFDLFTLHNGHNTIDSQWNTHRQMGQNVEQSGYTNTLETRQIPFMQGAQANGMQDSYAIQMAQMTQKLQATQVTLAQVQTQGQSQAQTQAHAYAQASQGAQGGRQGGALDEAQGGQHVGVAYELPPQPQPHAQIASASISNLNNDALHDHDELMHTPKLIDDAGATNAKPLGTEGE